MSQLLSAVPSFEDGTADYSALPSHRTSSGCNYAPSVEHRRSCKRTKIPHRTRGARMRRDLESPTYTLVYEEPVLAGSWVARGFFHGVSAVFRRWPRMLA